MDEEEFRYLAKEKGFGEVEFLEVGPGPEGGSFLFAKKLI